MAISDERLFFRSTSKPESSDPQLRTSLRRCDDCNGLFRIPEDMTLERTQTGGHMGHWDGCAHLRYWALLLATGQVTEEGDDPGGGGGNVTWARVDILFNNSDVTFGTTSYTP